MNSNQVTVYVALLLFLSAFFMVTIYLNPTSTNISVHINRLIPTEKGAHSIRGGKYWEYHVSKHQEMPSYPPPASKPNAAELLTFGKEYQNGDNVHTNIIESISNNVNDEIETSNRRIRNKRPIVGVLAQDIGSDGVASSGNFNYTSYIAASYIKWVESGGARAVPVLINQPDEYYQVIFNSVNGLLIPGGAVDFDTSGFARAGKKLFDLAIKANNEGDYWPIWGTCLGFELLPFLQMNGIHSLTRCSSMQQPLPLELTATFQSSRIGRSVPEDVYQTLTTKDSTMNFHNWCLSPTNFTYFEMDKFWDVLSTNHDKNGVEFISLLESKDHPIWGSQFHPEKLAYEWTAQYPKIPHDLESIHAGAFFSEFFVEETRKNTHKFIDRKTEEKNLIYNYSPAFTGNTKIDSTFVQSYYF